MTVQAKRVLGNGIVELYVDASKTSEWYGVKSQADLDGSWDFLAILV
jgi:hypothetical protein